LRKEQKVIKGGKVKITVVYDNPVFPVHFGGHSQEGR
jgi:hypothetical protein